ncbi:hypothetical protein CDIK_0372 [Cucumispora dikerogammari]|nr:hypothetical protein CDIK_0372 [Cucumispora dikerogammari]
MTRFLNRELIPLKQTEILSKLVGKVCIKETQHIDASALIAELAFELNLFIYSFYETKKFYRQNALFGIEDTDKDVGELKTPFLVDDTFTYINNGNDILKDGIYVFRSGSCTESDMFNFDVVVELMGLESGRSDILDGKMVIMRRDEILLTEFFVEKGGKLFFTQ